jgi:hypothetical protein
LEKIKEKTEKYVKSGKMYMENNGTHLNLDKQIFCTTVYSSFVPLIKGDVQQLFLQLDLTIIFHWLVSNDKDNRD